MYWSFYLHMLPSVVSLTTGDNPTLRHFSSFTQWMCVRPDLRYVWKNSIHDQTTRPRLDNGFVHSSWFFFSFCFVEKMPVRRRFFSLRSDGQINAAAAATPTSTTITTTWIRIPREKKRIKQCLPLLSLFLCFCLSFIICSISLSFFVPCVRAAVCISIYLFSIQVSIAFFVFFSFLSFSSLCIYILKEKLNKRSLKTEPVLSQGSLFAEIFENDTEVLLVQATRTQLTIELSCFFGQRSSSVNTLGCVCKTNAFDARVRTRIRYLPRARSRSFDINSLAKPPL